MSGNEEEMTSQLKRISFTAWGTVQGVFFRQNTIKKANELGITGWVRNTSDPSKVEGEAQSASQQDLDAFENHVEKHMPGAAKVDKYCGKKIPAVPGETGFKKRY